MGTDFGGDNLVSSNCKIVQIDNGAEHIGRSANVKLGIVGDVSRSLNHLLSIFEQNNDDNFLT